MIPVSQPIASCHLPSGHWSPLNQAVIRGQERYVGMLLAAGADPNLCEHGKSSLDIAANVYLFETVEGPTRQAALRVINLIKEYGGLSLRDLLPNPAPDVGVELIGGDDEDLGPQSRPPPLRALVMGEDAEQSSEERAFCESSRKSCARRLLSYLGDPWRCTRAEWMRNVNFCCNKKWCKLTPQRVLGVSATLTLHGTVIAIYSIYGLALLADPLNSLAAFLFMNGFEAGLNTLSLFQSAPPWVPVTSPDQLRELAVVIPVHGKDKHRDLAVTLQSIQDVGIDLDQVFIIENTGGRYSQAESGTYQMITTEPGYHAINYRWGSFGAKVAAEYLGCFLAKEAGFKYATTMDDDVIFPPGWDPGLNLFEQGDGRVKLIGYPIAASNSKPNWLTEQQGAEYSSVDAIRRFANHLDALATVHGAVSTVDLDQYLESMRKDPVDGRFSGEDYLKSLGMHFDGATVLMMGGPAVGTEVPDNLAMFCSQRLGSWDIGRHRLCARYLQHLSTESLRHCNLTDLLKLPFRLLLDCSPVWGNCSDALRCLLLPAVVGSQWFWITSAVLVEAKACTQIVRQSYCDPHHRRQAVCQPRVLAQSCLTQHTRVFYDILNMGIGWAACLANYTCAGAADAQDFPINLPYPRDLQQLLSIDDRRLRRRHLGRFVDEWCPSVPLRAPRRLVMQDDED